MGHWSPIFLERLHKTDPSCSLALTCFWTSALLRVWQFYAVAGVKNKKAETCIGHARTVPKRFQRNFVASSSENIFYPQGKHLFALGNSQSGVLTAACCACCFRRDRWRVKRAAGGMSEDHDRCFSTLVLGAFSTGVFNTNALPRINIGADVWGESSIMTGVC